MKTKGFSKALCLVLTLAMLLSISAMPMMASAASTQINPIILLDENFDGTDVVVGNKVNTLSGWSQTTEAGSEKVLDSDVTIATVDGSNVLRYAKTAVSSSSQSNEAKYTFDETYTGGVFSARMKFKLDSGCNRFQFTLKGEDSSGESASLIFNIRENSSNDMFLVGSSSDNNHYVKPNPISANTWYEYELIYDTTTKKAALYDVEKDECIWAFNTVVNNNVYTDLSVITGFGLQLTRTDSFMNCATEANFYIDDILMRGYKKAEFDAERLTVPQTYDGSALTLPTSGDAGSTITWTSDSDVVNAQTGAVTPAADTEVVTLTAAVNDGTNTVTQDFKIKVLGENVLLDEDFDVPAADDGTDISEYNGWTVVDASVDSSTYADDTTATVSGGALSVLRGDVENKKNSADYIMKKEYVRDALGGVIKVSFRANCSDSKAMRFETCVGGIWFDFNPAQQRAKVYSGSDTSQLSTDMVTNTAINKTGWNDIDISINLNACTADVAVNGAVIFKELYLTTFEGMASMFEIRTSRTANSSGAQFYFDDIKVEAVPSELNIVGIEFKDKDGSLAAGKTDGGSVSKITVMANDGALSGAAVVVGVYDGNGKLCSVGKGVASSTLDSLKGVDIPVNVALPAENAADAQIKVFGLNSMTSLAPVAYPVTYNRGAEDTITFWMCGDSMTRKYSDTEISEKNISGISNVIGNYFDETKVTVDNLAVGGRSTKTFYEANSLQNELANIKHGDYVFIMFGHNDQGADAEKHTEPYGTYQEYLTKFILMARSRGAIPVLMTPITRQAFVDTDDDDDVPDTFDDTCMGDYPPAMRDLAKELNVALIDNTAFSQDKWIGTLTQAAALQYYATDDTTHLSPLGTTYITENYIVPQIKALGLPVSIYIQGIE